MTTTDAAARLCLQAFMAASLALSSLTAARAEPALPNLPASPALSLQNALLQAQDRSRRLPAQEAAAQAAREMATAAGQRPDPVLTLGITNLPVDGPKRGSLTGDFMTMRSIGVMQELTRDDKRQARSARFEREADVAQARRWLALVDLRRETALAWLHLYFQQQLLAQVQAQRAEAELQVQAADAALRGGTGMQAGMQSMAVADTLAARSARAQMDDAIVQAQSEVESAQLRLARWTGQIPALPLAPPPPLSQLSGGEEPLRLRIAQHPQLLLLARQEASAEADVDIARSQQRSDWTVELMYGQRGSAYSNMLSLNLRLPLQWDAEQRQDRVLAARQAQQAAQRNEREEATREQLTAAQDLLQRWERERQRLDVYERELLPLAQDRVQAALASYRGGQGTLAAALQARQMGLQTQLQHTRVQSNAAALWARLEFLLVPAADTAARHPARTTTTPADRPADPAAGQTQPTHSALASAHQPQPAQPADPEKPE